MKPSENIKPHLIVTVGIPGSGKSLFAEHFADTFQAPIIGFDKIRRQIFTQPAFSDDEDEIIDKVANHVLDEVLKTKRTVIYEGKTNLRSDRTFISKKARDAGYDPLFIWVQTDPVSAKKRAIKPSLEKLALSPAQFDIKLKQFSTPHQNEKVIVISGKHTYASQLKIVLRHLIQPRTGDNDQDNLARPVSNRNFLIR